MFILEVLISNAWVLTAAIAAVIAALIAILYFQQEKIDTLEKRLDNLEKIE